MDLSTFTYGDIIEVTWLDILGDASWFPRTTVEKVKPICCLYSGYFVNADQVCLRCCNTVSCGDGDSDFYVFPLGVIQNIELIKRSTYECDSNSLQ
jgi:hypothetical protein